MVLALLVHRAHMPPQSARLPERSGALRARVVLALLVHRAHMRPEITRSHGLVGALRARVLFAVLRLLGHLDDRRGRFLQNQIEGLDFPLLSMRSEGDAGAARPIR